MGEWFEKSFGKDYLTVYKHRDMQGAYEEVKKMIAWLDLDEGAEILDLCCGMGRHALALVDFGYRVTGMDLSDVLLNEAIKRDPMGTVRWGRGDMRNIVFDGPFDAVVNLFTSFGYFAEDAENGKVLHEMGRVLRPGGRFIIDFLNPDFVIERLVAYSERMDGNLRVEETRKIEQGFVCKTIVLRETEQAERRYKERVKLYRLADFQRLLAGTGLRIDRTYGNYDGLAYEEATSPRLIIVGSKQDAGPV